METVLKIHDFIAHNDTAQVFLIWVFAELLKRLFPSKTPASLTEIAGKWIRLIFDKTKLVNKIKIEDGVGKEFVVDANPINKKT